MKCYGSAKTKHIRPSLYVNKRGFISIYALLILSVFMLFSSFAAQRIYTYAQMQKHGSQSYLLDVYIASEVKHYTTNKQSQEQDVEEDLSEPLESTTENVWNGMYQGIELQFTEKNTTIFVTFFYQGEHKQIEIQLDEETKEIMNYAYVT